jgi:hypothetical protein
LPTAGLNVIGVNGLVVLDQDAKKGDS